jgi:hypothetical protein
MGKCHMRLRAFLQWTLELGRMEYSTQFVYYLLISMLVDHRMHGVLSVMDPRPKLGLYFTTTY